MIKSTPLSFNKISEALENFLNPLSADVKTPAIIRIKPWPNENKNSINTAKAMFNDNDANVIMPAKIGVEQGVPAIAKIAPNNIGYKNVCLPEL